MIISFTTTLCSFKDFTLGHPWGKKSKTNKQKTKDTKTIIRIDNGNRLYGTLRISNMIPVPITELEPYMIETEQDRKYKEVILGELRYINNNVEKITKNAKIVYNQRIKNENIGYIKNTVNFKLLEEKLEEWNKM